jgi:hypothetical protein
MRTGFRTSITLQWAVVVGMMNRIVVSGPCWHSEFIVSRISDAEETALDSRATNHRGEQISGSFH